MSEKIYSAGGVKHAFWFQEFRQVVFLRNEGYSWDEIRNMCESDNILGASTPARAKQMFNTVSARIKCLDESFYPLFELVDLASKKIFALVAAMCNDVLFGEFVYEVVREQLIIGTDELSEKDFRLFFHRKQEQDEKIATWTDATIVRLSRTYKSILSEAGLLGEGTEIRPILKPILDLDVEDWLNEHGYSYYVKALTGVR